MQHQLCNFSVLKSRAPNGPVGLWGAPNIPMENSIEIKKTRFQVWLNPLLKFIKDIANNWISKLSPNIPMNILIINTNKNKTYEMGP